MHTMNCCIYYFIVRLLLFKFRKVKILFSHQVLILLLPLFSSHLHSMPSTQDRFSNYLRWTDFYMNNDCIGDNQLNDICEQCAKLTRNDYVYSLCCTNEDLTGDWCNVFINHSLD